MIRQFILSAILVFSLFSCNKENKTTNIVNYECENKSLVESSRIDDEEIQMMTECDNNALTDEEEIKSILTGTWELVGYAGGWLQSSQYDCVVLSFDGNTMQRRTINEDEDKTTEYEWAIEEIQYTNGVIHSLKITQDGNSSSLFNKFSDKYMYYNHTPADGNCEIYSPVK